VSGYFAEKQHEARVAVLFERPEIARALFVPDVPKSMLAFENDERPASVADGQTRVHELVAAVAPALGDTAREIGFSADEPEEITLYAAGEPGHERP
jgi:hypothetical protein